MNMREIYLVETSEGHRFYVSKSGIRYYDANETCLGTIREMRLRGYRILRPSKSK